MYLFFKNLSVLFDMWSHCWKSNYLTCHIQIKRLTVNQLYESQRKIKVHVSPANWGSYLGLSVSRKHTNGSFPVHEQPPWGHHFCDTTAWWVSRRQPNSSNIIHCLYGVISTTVNWYLLWGRNDDLSQQQKMMTRSFHKIRVKATIPRALCLALNLLPTTAAASSPHARPSCLFGRTTAGSTRLVIASKEQFVIINDGSCAPTCPWFGEFSRSRTIGSGGARFARHLSARTSALGAWCRHFIWNVFAKLQGFIWCAKTLCVIFRAQICRDAGRNACFYRASAKWIKQEVLPIFF